MEMGQKLRDLREDRDLTRKEVAFDLQMHPQQLYKYETGIQEMTASKIKAICEYYGVSADYVLGLPRGLSWPR